MINPINHYALTPSQPGVINEEAYTVLELVGECGRKINEIISNVNEAIETVESVDARITTAQEAADAAQASANAAAAGVIENDRRISNVSSIALEGRSMADAAQAAANAAQETADAGQTTANNALATAQYAKVYVDNMAMFQGVLWWADPIVDGGELTNGFVQFLISAVSQLLNNAGKYYDLTSNGPGNPCTILKFYGYCATSQIEYGENCVGLVNIELDIYKPVSEFSSASILVHYKQHIASGAPSTGAGPVFDVETTITLPAEVYSESNPYDPDAFYSNRLCLYREYDFQL